MKNIIIFIGLLLSFFTSSAQISTWSSVDIRDHFRLKDKTVSTISTDTTFAGANDITLPTAKAVKAYVDNRPGGGTIDSLDVIKLKGDTIDRKHLPVFKTKLSNEGGGVGILYGTGSDTIHAKSLKAGTNVTLVPNADSSVTINATGGGGSTDTTSLSNRINTKQDALTLTTTGTSGAATLTGNTLNIPNYQADINTATITETKKYYHGEFYWNHGLNTSTGAFTSDAAYDISDYMPVDGGKSLKIFVPGYSVRPVTVYGWTYDSLFTPISEIRSNSLIGTKLYSYTFTTPSNARYLVVLVKAATDSFHAKLNIESVDSITYVSPVTPEQFTGTATQKIQKAVNFARFTSSTVVLNGAYGLDSAIFLSSGNKVVLNNAFVYRNTNNHDNIFRNEAVKDPNNILNRGNVDISIVGIGNAVIQGSNSSWGGSYPDSVNGQYWRSNAVLFANVDKWGISNIKFKDLNASAIIPEQSRNGTLSNITVSGTQSHTNEGGIIIGRGTYNLSIDNVSAVGIDDDLIAVQNIPDYKADSLNILGTVKNYIPYHLNDSLKTFGINIKNVSRGAVPVNNSPATPPTFGGSIRILATGSGIVSDVSIDGLSGYSEILIQAASSAYGVQNINSVTNLTVTNTGQAPIYINQPIKNSSFFNVAKYDTSRTYASCVFPNGSLNNYRKYYGEKPQQVDSVSGGVEFINVNSSWQNTGNTGTDTTNYWLGTNDNKPMSVRINNSKTFLFSSTGLYYGRNLNFASGSYYSRLDTNAIHFVKVGSSDNNIKFTSISGSTAFAGYGGGAGTTLIDVVGPVIHTTKVASGNVATQYEALTVQGAKNGGPTVEALVLDNAYATNPKRIIIYAQDAPVSILPGAGNLLVGATASSDVASSKMTLFSTTQGAIPVPKMTKTQRNAIASPSAGLQVIVTGETGGEYLSWYNSSTSSWVKVTSTSD